VFLDQRCSLTHPASWRVGAASQCHGAATQCRAGVATWTTWPLTFPDHIFCIPPGNFVFKIASLSPLPLSPSPPPPPPSSFCLLSFAPFFCFFCSPFSTFFLPPLHSAWWFLVLFDWSRFSDSRAIRKRVSLQAWAWQKRQFGNCAHSSLKFKCMAVSHTENQKWLPWRRSTPCTSKHVVYFAEKPFAHGRLIGHKTCKKRKGCPSKSFPRPHWGMLTRPWWSPSSLVVWGRGGGEGGGAKPPKNFPGVCVCVRACTCVCVCVCTVGGWMGR
jgi:hypothetical protein